jgi:hypothetical protein
MDGGFSILVSDQAAKDNSEIVDLVRIDDCIEPTMPHVSAIKIDVDGADLDVLEGCGEIVARDRPIVLIELTSREEERLFSVCGKIGYSVAAYVSKNAGLVFTELSFHTICAVSYKMLFLAPPEKMKQLVKLHP